MTSIQMAVPNEPLEHSDVAHERGLYGWMIMRYAGVKNMIP